MQIYVKVLISIKAGRWIFAGTNSGQRHQGLRAQAMSIVTLGNSIASIGNLKNNPDHLLVLVHGILARDVIYYVERIKICLNYFVLKYE